MFLNFLKSNKIITFLLAIAVPVGVVVYTAIPDNNTNSSDENDATTEVSKLDTDGDTLSDDIEKNLYKTDPLKADTDDDGILDNVEIMNGTDPLKADTDGDGLLDGKFRYVNNKKVAPIDPNPLVYDGPKGVWHKQIQIEELGNIPYYLTDFYEYNPNGNSLSRLNDIDWNKLQSSGNVLNEVLNSPYFKEFASKTLMFRLDNGGTILHSQSKKDLYDYVMGKAKEKLSSTNYAIFQSAIKTLKVEDSLETWQKQFGYNKLYDEVFKVATNGNIRHAQLYFKDSAGSDYVLWLWKGDYLVLGSGAEMGLYKKNTTDSNLKDLNLEHWDAVNFEVPMTLNLYNYHSENNIEHLFSWKPTNAQWWITGFNPNDANVDVTKHVMIGTVNLSDHKDMYNSLKEQAIANSQLKNYVMFDDEESTVWIYWY